MNYHRLINEAVQVHKKLIELDGTDACTSRLEKRADEIHDILHMQSASDFFVEYVLSVHQRTGCPMLLLGRKGVKECLERLGVNFAVAS
jgi:hypothetical protein